MTWTRWAVAGLLVAGIARAQDQSIQPQPVSTNPADSPPRVFSGKVFASTDPNLPPAYGPLPAKVIVLVFSDFQCPVCKRCADATQQIAEEFPGEVRLEFWQHALSTHGSAENAAVASLAAQRQGSFWEYHDVLFRNQSALDAASLARYAEQLGLDVDRFNKDCADPKLRARVKAEGAFAEQLGATSTPSFVINGKLHIGWGSWAGFRSDVERELAESMKLAAQGVPLEQLAEKRARALIADDTLFDAYEEKVLRAASDPPPARAEAVPAKKSGKKTARK
jgi:protein-disulfide isomerase